jgi:hypothetical protein
MQGLFIMRVAAPSAREAAQSAVGAALDVREPSSGRLAFCINIAKKSSSATGGLK